jgi:hypothetical protein
LAHFEELSQYKNNIAYKLITNANLVKALANTNKDFINQSLPIGFEETSLLYTQIFPYKFIPSINTEAKTFITMSFGNYNYINNEFKYGTVYFYIISHSSLIQTDYGLRYDYILNQIDLMFNKQYEIGAFNLELNNGGDLPVNENYFGSVISYKFTDFQ